VKDYRTIVVGTDGSALAEPTVRRAAWLAAHENAGLVVVCAFSELPRRVEAGNVATLGGDVRIGQVLGRVSAEAAVDQAVAVAGEEGARVLATALVDAEPSRALLDVAHDRGAELLVVGARRDRSIADRLLGTVATEVTKRAACDVLVIRPGSPEELPVPEG
jgi:nucleotide-binding universal stress UspA family protein